MVCFNRLASIGNETCRLVANYFNKNSNFDMGSNPPQEVGRNYDCVKYPPTVVGLFRVNARSPCSLCPVARLSFSLLKARQRSHNHLRGVVAFVFFGGEFCAGVKFRKAGGSCLVSDAQYRYNEGMFIANPVIYRLNPLLHLAMAFSHYRQWLDAQAFLRQRDPFFTDPPLAV